jgi:hypothetical protein
MVIHVSMVVTKANKSPYLTSLIIAEREERGVDPGKRNANEPSKRRTGGGRRSIEGGLKECREERGFKR